MRPKQSASTCFQVTVSSQKVVIKFADVSEKMKQEMARAAEELGEYSTGEI